MIECDGVGIQVIMDCGEENVVQVFVMDVDFGLGIVGIFVMWFGEKLLVELIEEGVFVIFDVGCQYCVCQVECCQFVYVVGQYCDVDVDFCDFGCCFVNFCGDVVLVKI